MEENPCRTVLMRLYPNEDQKNAIDRSLMKTCYMYNALVYVCRHLDEVPERHELYEFCMELRRKNQWLSEIPVQVAQDTVDRVSGSIRTLEEKYAAESPSHRLYFKKPFRYNSITYPSPGSFSFMDTEGYGPSGHTIYLELPGMGLIEACSKYKVNGHPGTCCVSRKREDGRKTYYAFICRTDSNRLTMNGDGGCMGLFGKKKGPVLKEMATKIHWDVEDPFIMASHHFDQYPKGNEIQAPPYAEIKRRSLGQDYQKLLGYRMYCGKVTPGFPLHAHWGYETVTVASIGYVDHYDSMGNQGRYGYGDMQWVSASSKYQHCEMYPLAYTENENPTRITQIHINLPLDDKNKENHVKTVWFDEIPRFEENGCTVHLICGRYKGRENLPPNPRSWASAEEHHVRILKLEMSPGSKITLEPSGSVNRNIYVTETRAMVAGTVYQPDTRLKVDPTVPIDIEMGEEGSEVWVLEGDPINEKQSRYGPIALGNDKEVRTALQEVRRMEREDWGWTYINQKQPLGTKRFFEDGEGNRQDPATNPGEHTMPAPLPPKVDEKPAPEGKKAEPRKPEKTINDDDDDWTW
ncbi:MAG: pirin family protein [archaeon]|nr:pirin family protein [archaeon]